MRLITGLKLCALIH